MCLGINRYENMRPIPKAESKQWAMAGGNRKSPPTDREIGYVKFGHWIPKSDTRRQAERGSAEYPPCFESIAQLDMEDGLRRMKRIRKTSDPPRRVTRHSHPNSGG